MMKKSIILLLVFSLVASMFLVACGPKETTTTDGGDSTDVAINNPATGRGNVLTIGGSNWNGSFNPVTWSTAYDHYIVGLTFDPLLSWEADTTLTTKGGLLESYEMSDDGLVFTFKLREGIKFHDDTELTAEDVAFTYDVIMRPDYKGRLFNNVRDIVGAVDRKDGKAEVASGIEVLDKYTIQITMTTPKATNLRNIATLQPMPKHYYDKATFDEMAELDRDPIGTGAFKMKDHVIEQYIELEANKEYWQGVPKLDGIIYKHVARANELSEFEIGSIDAVNFETAKENYEIIQDYEHGNLINNWNNGYAYAGFNFTNPIFQDQRVRQALVYGVDRHGFVESFFGPDGAFVAQTPISPVSWAFPESGLNEYKYNPEKAAELLDEAGWKLESDGWRYKDGQKLAFTWKTYQEAAWAVQFPALAKENWKQLGIDVDIELMDFNSLATLLTGEENKGAWDMFNMAWGLTTDPDMQSTFGKSNTPPGNNRGYYYNEKIEELMEKGVLELDQAKRKEIYNELALEFNKDLPYIFVYMRTNPWLVNKRVKNFNPTEFRYFFQDAHLIEIVQ